MRSSAGSTQNAVLAMPPQAYSPGEPTIRAFAGSSITDTPRPNPTPVNGVSENVGWPMSARSPGSWFAVMCSTVLRPRSRVSPRAPRPLSMRVNRR